MVFPAFANEKQNPTITSVIYSPKNKESKTRKIPPFQAIFASRTLYQLIRHKTAATSILHRASENRSVTQSDRKSSTSNGSALLALKIATVQLQQRGASHKLQNGLGRP